MAAKQNTLTIEEVLDGLGFNSVDNALSRIQTTSGKIRYLTSLNWTRKDIANKLDIRYQHVRNVQLQVLKKGEDK